MPIDQRVNGLSADVTLRRAATHGERWEKDWEAEDYVDNHHGGQESVIDMGT